MKDIEKLEPRAFTRFCMSIGAVPSSYIAGLTIEEQLLWFCSYLEKTVIPAVNNNAEAVTELQNLYTQLQQYVNDYFENLDVQEEINNKLDDMAESGELEAIIGEYLQLAGILAYNTKAEMKAAENLVDGSICKTLGNSTYSDGQGNFYRVREIINTDVVDDDNIIALHDENLVAEKIPYSSGYALQSQITTNTNNLSLLMNKKYLVIGDSYANGVTNTDQTTTSWVEYFKTAIGSTNVTKLAENGAGFVTTGEQGHTFKTLVEANIESITDKNAYTDILICGGINDVNQTVESIESAISTCITYLKTNFPNAKIYLGMISNRKDMSSGGESVRFNLMNKILRAYQYACKQGGYYLNGVEKILKYKYFISADNTHPTQTGYEYLGGAIAQSLQTGSVTWSFNSLKDIQITNVNISTNNLSFRSKIFNDMFYMSCDGGYVEFTNTISEDQNNNLQLGNINDSEYFSRVIGNTFAVNLTVVVTTGDGNTFACPAMFNIEDNGNVYIKPYLWKLDGTGHIAFSGVKRIQFSAFNLTVPVLLA